MMDFLATLANEYTIVNSILILLAILVFVCSVVTKALKPEKGFWLCVVKVCDILSVINPKHVTVIDNTKGITDKDA